METKFRAEIWLLLLLVEARRPCNVRSFGAVGDGRRDNTEAFRRAAECEVMMVPRGRFVTGAFNVTHLRLSKGAVILGASFHWSTWQYHYPATEPTRGYRTSRDACCVPWSSSRVLSRPAQLSALITVRGSIVGDESSVIDGRGQEFWLRFLCASLASASQYAGFFFFFSERGCPQSDDDPAFRLSNVGYPLGRPRLVEIFSGDRVLLKGLHIKNSPFWSVHVVESSRVDLEDLEITAPNDAIGALLWGDYEGWGPNTDGIDVSSSADVRIRRVTINVGDDAIALKSGLVPGAPPTERITIEDSHLQGQWLSIGSETAGDVTRVLVRNVTFGSPTFTLGADLYDPSGGPTGIHIKMAPDRGGLIDDIDLVNLSVSSGKAALWISQNYPTDDQTVSTEGGRINRVSLRNVHCHGCSLLDVQGPIDNLVVSRSHARDLGKCVNANLHIDRESFPHMSHGCSSSRRRTSPRLYSFGSVIFLLLRIAVGCVALRIATTQTLLERSHRRRRFVKVCWSIGAAATVFYGLLWLIDPVRGVGSALSSSLALTPGPLSAPFLRVLVVAPVLSVLTSLTLALGSLYAVIRERDALLSTIVRLWLGFVGLAVFVDLLTPETVRRGRRSRYCVRAWDHYKRNTHPGVHRHLLVTACADFLALGEPAALGWGHLSSCLALILARHLVRTTSS